VRAAGVIGFERVPTRVRGLLADAAGVLVATANELDTLVTRGGAGPRAEIGRLAADGHRIRDDLAASVGHARRVGPDGVRLLAVAEAMSVVVDGLDDVAWAWSRHPADGLSRSVLIVRDLARELARAVLAIDGDEREAHLLRAAELAHDARSAGRSARARLLTEAAPVTVLSALELLDSVERCLLAAKRLRHAVRRYALT
jgi:hypothetical protein